MNQFTKNLPYSLFIYQDKNEDENQNQSFGSFVTGLFQNIQERTKALVFVFVFVLVLVDEQAISLAYNSHPLELWSNSDHITSTLSRCSGIQKPHWTTGHRRVSDALFPTGIFCKHAAAVLVQQ